MRIRASYAWWTGLQNDIGNVYVKIEKYYYVALKTKTIFSFNRIFWEDTKHDAIFG